MAAAFAEPGKPALSSIAVYLQGDYLFLYRSAVTVPSINFNKNKQTPPSFA